MRRAKRLRDRGFEPAEKKYWNNRYMEDKESIEWYQSPQALQNLLRRHVQPGMKVLIVGCGNSELGATLYDSGVLDIINIDFSDVVIEQQREKNKDRDGMSWETMSVLEMDDGICPPEFFDVVIDKACFDCVVSNPGSARNGDLFLSGVSKRLKPQGLFIHVTFALPQRRVKLLEVPGYKWDVTYDKNGMEKPSIDNNMDKERHYVYVMKKQF